MPEKLLTKSYRLYVINFTADIASIKGSFVSNPKTSSFFENRFDGFCIVAMGFRHRISADNPSHFGKAL